jgi:hypothetical protein
MYREQSSPSLTFGGKVGVSLFARPVDRVGRYRVEELVEAEASPEKDRTVGVLGDGKNLSDEVAIADQGCGQCDLPLAGNGGGWHDIIVPSKCISYQALSTRPPRVVSVAV